MGFGSGPLPAAVRDEVRTVRLRDAGVVGQVRAAHQWVLAHRDTLDRALR
ncbi:hypothetical protein GCM10010341_57580 [Streptomyces noursei]|nr:hypothetical protein GCM10010341_57580 [Streptomyces noursei]